MGYGEKASSLGMWTYSPLEGGMSAPSYQVLNDERASVQLTLLSVNVAIFVVDFFQF